MRARQLLGKLRWQAISAVSRRELPLCGVGPVVSFTFDDFPQSALHAGGAILKDHGARGTYYAAMGLKDQTNGLGRHFSTRDLEDLLREGHELGSHTFSHLSGRSASIARFEQDVLKGKKAVEEITGGGGPHQFSYPYGHVTFRGKPRMGLTATSCRGICGGVNTTPADLNLLRANSLYSDHFDLAAIHRLFDANEKCRGWLVFYTHDVSTTPSAFGCRPSELESTVKIALRRGAKILPVGELLYEVSAMASGLNHGQTSQRSTTQS